MTIKKRKKKSEVDEITEETFQPVPFDRKKPIRFDKVVSTGSTLLDLAISGKRVRGGGIPGGIVVEIFGGASLGKTGLLSEIAASAQVRGGDVIYADPEARLDHEYSEIYGISIPKNNYHRPDTVTEMFDKLWNWNPKGKKGSINVSCNDSLAALSTKLEMEKDDKMGMRRAKEFSEGLRKTCRIIAENNWLVVCSNQVREGDKGVFTPGGKAVPFYSSLRIQITPFYGADKINKEIKLNLGEKFNFADKKKEDLNYKEQKFSKVLGIKSNCYIYKSSLDDPFRYAPIYLVFGFGIDDTRANLQFVKDVTGDTVYDGIRRRSNSMGVAIRYVEEDGTEEELRNRVIDLWEEIENNFSLNRKPKIRR